MSSPSSEIIGEQSVKVVLLGDSGVGKSSLALRFVTNEFKPYSESTVGASFMSKSIRVPITPSSELDKSTEVERNVGLKIWDTAGQEKYRSLAPMCRWNSPWDKCLFMWPHYYANFYSLI